MAQKCPVCGSFGKEKAAKDFATLKHANRKRKDNITPYIAHPSGVVDILKSLGVTDPDVISAAWLHDVMEDEDIPIRSYLRDLGQKLLDTLELLQEVL